jgi:hypothetical protein
MIVRVHGGPEKTTVASLLELKFGLAKHQLEVGIPSHIPGAGVAGVGADVGAAVAGADAGACDDDDYDDDIVADSGAGVQAAGLDAGFVHLLCDPGARTCPCCTPAPGSRVRNDERSRIVLSMVV